MEVHEPAVSASAAAAQFHGTTDQLDCIKSNSEGIKLAEAVLEDLKARKTQETCKAVGSSAISPLFHLCR